MQKTIDAVRARGVLVALIGALVLVAGPATAQAQSEPRGTRAEVGLMAAGAGYSSPHGSARVRALQRRLLRAGESPGPVDGLFGPLTEAAVLRFQNRQRLAVDGLVGPLTTAALKGAATAALKGAAALIGPGAGYGEPHGSNRVRALQRRLRRAGERPGPVDGRFGPLTESAVRHFQHHYGLVVDGLVGEATWGVLARRSAVLAAERRRDRAPRPQELRVNTAHRASTKPKATKEPQPAQVGKGSAPANSDDSGFELPVWAAMVAIAAALALLSRAALALVLGRRPARRHAGAQIRSRLLTRPLRPQPSTPGARGLELRRPPAPKVGGPDGQRGVERPADLPSGPNGTRLLGYASVSGAERSVNWSELGKQEELIAGECERRGFELLELVRDRGSHNGKALERPGLGYALRRISAGEARGLAVSELSRLTRSVAELGTILEWFIRSDAQLVAVAEGIDTGDRAGRLTARTLIEVSGWEREGLRARTQKGLEAARLEGRPRGRPAVADNPELVERITQMRTEGMTLQAIADSLNEEGVPTVRGGVEWRPSSVQTSLGYKRRRPRTGALPGKNGSPGERP